MGDQLGIVTHFSCPWTVNILVISVRSYFQNHQPCILHKQCHELEPKIDWVMKAARRKEFISRRHFKHLYLIKNWDHASLTNHEGQGQVQMGPTKNYDSGHWMIIIISTDIDTVAFTNQKVKTTKSKFAAAYVQR